MPNILPENPHFERANRAPYELGRLLQKLPEHSFPYDPLNPELVQIADAAARHAANANSTLMYGLEALGSLIHTAAASDDFEMEPAKIADLGFLIQHIAVEAQFLQETRTWLNGELERHAGTPQAPAAGPDNRSDR